MFSSRVSSLGLAKSLQASIPHTAPVDGAVTRPFAYKAPKPAVFARQDVAPRGLVSSGLTATVNSFGNHQVRYAHTDISCPDFSESRRESCMDPHQSAQSSKYQRRAFTYGATALATIPGLYMGKSVAKSYAKLYEADAFSLALSKVEVDLSNVQAGYGMTVMFQGKPLFIRHRTDAEIAALNNTNMAELRDAQADADRFENQKWTVVIGICTHLGCVPVSHAGDWNGYFCPCHGSHYDISGRVRKGPAPLNLEVPKFKFVDDLNIIVG